jgi:hypothetical protein
MLSLPEKETVPPWYTRSGDCLITLLALPAECIELERFARPDLNAQSPPFSSGP